MTGAGRAVLPDMSEKGFVILEALQADMEIGDIFQKFPSLYQRVRIDTIQIKKKTARIISESFTKTFG